MYLGNWGLLSSHQQVEMTEQKRASMPENQLLSRRGVGQPTGPAKQSTHVSRGSCWSDMRVGTFTYSSSVTIIFYAWPFRNAFALWSPCSV